MTESVRNTAEFRRVRDLPRRVPSAAIEGVDLVAELTDALKTPRGTMRLRSLQAIALGEIASQRGLFGSMEVGAGKTLITALAPYVLDAKRPILLIPANLYKKTQRELAELSRDWLVPNHIRLITYQMLGLVQAENTLDVYEPDLIMADEVHKLKNRRAAVTRRVARYMSKHPETPFVGLSGTPMSRSIIEFGHILRWCLKDRAPVPSTQEELEEWAAALDEDLSGRPGDELARFDPGALLELCSPEDLAEGPLAAARKGFRRRLVQSPGVVSTMEAERVDATIRVRAITYDVPDSIDAAFAKLRSAWLSPADDYPLTSGAEVWAHAKALALGLVYVWDPRPPEEWLGPRRDWGAFVREVIAHSRTLDSELHVAQAVAAGKLDDEGRLARWCAVRDSFVPNPKPRWFDDTVLRLCARWAREHVGIVWTEHAFFAERLAELTGLSYYGQKGLNARGEFIDDAPAGRSVIASIDANREGRNLQKKWSQNLITSLPENSGAVQQTLGRTHRPGQTALVVTADILLGCREHANAWRKVMAGARAVRDTTGADNKLLMANVSWPEDDVIDRYRGARWAGTSPREIGLSG